MTEYDNTNRGSIWKNEEKKTEKHPDFTGSANIDGTDYRVSAWKRKDGANPKAPALSFSFRAKDGDERKTSEPEPKQEEFQEDEIPFN